MLHKGPYVRVRNNGIDCQVNHPIYGWIPTTLDENDVLTSVLWNEVNSSGVNIEDYVERDPNEPIIDSEIT